jgi:hypothetical protein
MMAAGTSMSLYLISSRVSARQCYYIGSIWTIWKDLADFVLYQAAVDPSTAALARPSDVVEAQFRADKNLDTFFTACDAACGEGIVAQARHIPPAKAVEQPVGIRFLL